MEPRQIIESIKAERPEIRTLYFVGCGASSSELYPAEYFMNANARVLRTGFYTANEFNYATPVACDESAIVIACSSVTVIAAFSPFSKVKPPPRFTERR